MYILCQNTLSIFQFLNISSLFSDLLSLFLFQNLQPLSVWPALNKIFVVQYQHNWQSSQRGFCYCIMLTWVRAEQVGPGPADCPGLPNLARSLLSPKSWVIFNLDPRAGLHWPESPKIFGPKPGPTPSLWPEKPEFRTSSVQPFAHL